MGKANLINIFFIGCMILGKNHSLYTKLSNDSEVVIGNVRDIIEVVSDIDFDKKKRYSITFDGFYLLGNTVSNVVKSLESLFEYFDKHSLKVSLRFLEGNYMEGYNSLNSMIKRDNLSVFIKDIEQSIMRYRSKKGNTKKMGRPMKYNVHDKKYKQIVNDLTTTDMSVAEIAKKYGENYHYIYSIKKRLENKETA